MRVGDWQVCEIGAEVGDCGLNSLELVRGWGRGIVGQV
jgi:hypothetical protein